MPQEAISRARDELEFQDLIVFQAPLYQVLSLPQRAVRGNSSQPAQIRDIMRQVVNRHAKDRTHSHKD